MTCVLFPLRPPTGLADGFGRKRSPYRAAAARIHPKGIGSPAPRGHVTAGADSAVALPVAYLRDLTAATEWNLRGNAPRYASQRRNCLITMLSVTGRTGKGDVAEVGSGVRYGVLLHRVFIRYR